MNNLPQIFTYRDAQVRTIEIDGQVWFVLKDVCNVLELTNARMVKERLNEDVSSTYPLQTPGGIQQSIIINEDGLYDVILESRKPEAKAFRKWVTSEVLPSIRKTGSYNITHDPQQLIALALVEAQKIIEGKDRMIAIMQPKAEFFDAVADSKDAIDIGTAAKVLKIPGVGRNNLFEILRNASVLMANNQPYQRYIDSGHFRVIEQKYNKPDGSTHINIKTLVYQKGLDFIRKLAEKKQA
ncbi:phage antirepressor [Paenibacillus sp. GYB004]|uniref:phage antirepressor n=1 Tax=Paenibacillus sp. GYB004 TaxID=2994393 RepID=UPI002F96594E